MVNRMVAAGLGILTGLVGLIAMLRLILGAFGPGAFGLGFVLAAMLPWVVYVTYRAQHGRLTPVRALAVFGCCVVGLVAVWLFTIGPVIALALSLAAFAVIWVSDWPAARPQTESRFVHIEELTGEDAESTR
ncbi:hypothetical protein [Microlunatus ginsengisoli]|uniref:Uncharacterized protein n=1 Tax=Microlunatus ginsengisoli TaxID=363863 RepID=A0ABP6ZA08_9ACTN